MYTTRKRSNPSDHMTSQALVAWQSERRDRIEDLLDLHHVAGSGPGRRWRLHELNHSLILKLAAEFQGFSRDLHQLASEAVATALSGGSPAVQDLVLKSLTRGRKLDTANATAGNVAEDFRRLGIALWDSLDRDASGGTRPKTVRARARLEALNLLRNAIVHSNPTVDLQQGIGLLEGRWKPGGIRVASTRTSVRKEEVERIRSSLDYLAANMDRIVGVEIAAIFAISQPW